MEEQRLIPLAPILVESTRSIGYTFESALADIIDNSLSVNASIIEVEYSSHPTNAYLCILDNGAGMGKEELRAAMRYGSRSSLDARNSTDLGRFGLGMKTASMSQCRELTVISKKNGKLSAAIWDLDYIFEKSDWIIKELSEAEIFNLDIPTIKELKEFDSGTLVMWRKFDKLEHSAKDFNKSFLDKINLARDHVALVFHRYISGDGVSMPVKIYFNREPIVAIDPFLTTHPGSQPLEEQKIRIDGSDVLIKPYILPHISKISEKYLNCLGQKEDLKKNQGFYLYRNKRLIVWGTWFGLHRQYELEKLTRIRVDIPSELDSLWSIDIKKSTAMLPDKIKRNLIGIIQNSVPKSKSELTYKGRKTSGSEIKMAWYEVDNRGEFLYKISRDTALFKLVESHIDEPGLKYMEAFLRDLEDQLPYLPVYKNIAESKRYDETPQLSEDEILSLAETNIEMLVSAGFSESDAIAIISKEYTYSRYPKVIATLKVKERLK